MLQSQKPLRGIEPRIADYKSAVIPFNYSGKKLNDGVSTRESSVVHLSNHSPAIISRHIWVYRRTYVLGLPTSLAYVFYYTVQNNLCQFKSLYFSKFCITLPTILSKDLELFWFLKSFKLSL